MSIVLLPRRWQRTPPSGTPLVASGSLLRGLVSATLPHDIHGWSSGPQGPGTIAGTLKRIRTAGGDAIDFSVGGSIAFAEIPYLAFPITVVVGFTPQAAYDQAIISCGNQTLSTGWYIGQGDNTANDIQWYRFGLGETGNLYTTTAGKPIALAMTLASPLVETTYINGVQVHTGSGGTLPILSTAGLMIGNTADGGNPFGGALHYAYVYTRVLSASEILSFAQDPYQIWAPPSEAASRYLVSAPSGTVTTETATATGSTTLTATLSAIRKLTSVVTGVSTVTPVIIGKHYPVVAIPGIASPVALLSAIRTLTVATTGIATPIVTAHRWRNVTGSVTGQATPSVSVGRLRNTTTTAQGTASPVLTINAHRTAVVGSVTGVAGVQTVGVRWRNVPLGSVAGVGNVTSAINARRTITPATTGIWSSLYSAIYGAGLIQGTSTTSANIGAHRSLTASAGGFVTLTAGLLKKGSSAAIVNSTATVSTVAGRIRIAQLALTAGTSAPTVALGAHRAITTTLSALSGVTVIGEAKHWVTTSVAGVGTSTVTGNARRGLSTAVAGQSVLVLTLAKAGSLSIAVSGHTTLNLSPSAKRSVIGVVQGAGSASTTVAAIRGVMLTLNGLTSPSIFLNAIYGHETPAGQGLATVAAAIGKLNNQTHVASEVDGLATAIALCGKLVVPPSVIGKYSSQHLQAVSILGATRDLSGMHTRALAMLAEKGV